jgi:uncharacterized protein (TIGR03067 family)
MTRLTLTTAAVLLAGGLAFAQDKVEGTYTLKSAMQGGKAAPPAFVEAVKEIKFTAAEMVFVTTDGKEQKDAIKVDAKAGTIDVTAGGKTRQGLFKVDKDELTVVIGAADGKRPTDFKGEGDGVRLLVLTKKK